MTKTQRTDKATQLALDVARHLEANDHNGKALGIDILEVGPGFAKTAMTIRDTMTNGHGIAHGGMIFCLADTAFAYACNSRNEATVAQAATITFLAPARVGDRLIAEASEQAKAGRTGSFSVTVSTAEGQIIATFHGLSRTFAGAVIETESDASQG
ncbi:MAG: hydroxyphenylacetyl-CoA thioesterase PaaI [Pseudomonadota bacterium]